MENVQGGHESVMQVDRAGGTGGAALEGGIAGRREESGAGAWMLVALEQ